VRPVGLRRDVEDVPKCWPRGNPLSSDSPTTLTQNRPWVTAAPDVSPLLYRFRDFWALLI